MDNLKMVTFAVFVGSFILGFSAFQANKMMQTNESETASLSLEALYPQN